MRLSRFVVTYRDVGPGEHILYSVLSDRYIGVDDATLDLIAKLEHSDPLNEHEIPTADLLAELGFLVASRTDDDQGLREHLDKASEGVPGTLAITLMPTMACNLACHYCVQKESPAFNRMTEATERSTVEWILRRVDATHSRRLMICYVGGEPLTRKDFLLRTAEIFHSGMQARGGEFDYDIITNGVNLDPAFVRAIQRFGEGSYKVTLDGDKETHDAARIYRDGRGTFDLIFSNLLAVADHARIRVEGNFLPHQAASYQRLLARLESSGLAEKLSSVRFRPVVETSRSAAGSCSDCASSKESTSTLIQIDTAVKNSNLPVASKETVEGMLGPCELHWKNNFTIDPDGYVYKCPALAGRTEVAAGAVLEDTVGPAPLLELRPWEKCGDCPYLPVCMGGCLGSVYLRTGRRDEVHCRKDQFEYAFKDTITRRYAEEMDGREWEPVPVAVN